MLLNRRYARLAVCLLLCPSCYYCGILSGVMDYRSGGRTLLFYGIPNVYSYNPDPRGRFQLDLLFMYPQGNRGTYMGLHNFGMTLAAWMDSSATGSGTNYPGESDCKDALADFGETIDVDALRHDQVILRAMTWSLDEGVGEKLVDMVWQQTVIGEVRPSALPQITAVVCDGFLVIRVPTIRTNHRWSAKSAAVAIIDPQNHRPFVWYPDGDYWQTSPPIPWHKPDSPTDQKTMQ